MLINIRESYIELQTCEINYENNIAACAYSHKLSEALISKKDALRKIVCVIELPISSSLRNFFFYVRLFDGSEYFEHVFPLQKIRGHDI